MTLSVTRSRRSPPPSGPTMEASDSDPPQIEKAHLLGAGRLGNQLNAPDSTLCRPPVKCRFLMWDREVARDRRHQDAARRTLAGIAEQRRPR
jgi:hypothetical protein